MRENTERKMHTEGKKEGERERKREGEREWEKNREHQFFCDRPLPATAGDWLPRGVWSGVFLFAWGVALDFRLEGGV